MADPSATPLSNADFRRLLATPRSERGPPPASSAGAFLKPPSSTPRSSGEGKGGHHHHRKGGQDGDKSGRRGEGGKHGKPGKPVPKEEVDGDETKYRDRADERRKGVNPDYEGSDKMASLLSADVAYERLSIDETKFLGGDVEHTHLVKGLDYALLQKERSKLSRDELEGEAAGQGDGAQAPAAKAVKPAGVAVPKLEDLEVRTPMARSVFEAVFRRPRIDVHEMFLPRRTAFVYDFESEDVVDTDIPTTLRRSKADCPPVQESVHVGCDATVLERIAKILSYVKTSAGGKKIRKKDRQEILDILSGGAPKPAAAAAGGGKGSASKAPGAPLTHGSTAGPVDEDDDIFGGSGRDYTPAVPGKKKAGLTAAAKRDDMDVEEGEAVPPPPPPAPGHGGGYSADGSYGPAAGQYAGSAAYMNPEEYEAYLQQQIAYQAANDPEYQALLARQQGVMVGTGSAAAPLQPAGRGTFSSELSGRAGSVLKHGGDESKWRARPKAKEEREVDAYEDAYGECYPMQAAFDGAIGEDDEDMTHMDDKGKPGMSRYDFTTEEEWQRYKETREQAPKAAFQFGLKAADGRKSHKGLKEAAAGSSDRKKDGKLDLQLRNIERVMKEKGHDHSGAFAAFPAQTPGRGPAIGDSPAPFRPKKQRI